VIRKATPEDEAHVEQNVERAKEAEAIALEKIEKHGLDMKLVDVEYTFDNSKLIFYFTADGRVDFRELVKDLASIFRTRIELRQIGVRDEAKLLGGIGPCGRVTCCNIFLGDFDPVSIKMAKQQNLSLNPVKISGLCGRLMCCLRFESESYEDSNENYPDIGDSVVTPGGEGVVVGIFKPKGIVKVQMLENNDVLEFPVEEVAEADS
jgi:cell fate regulator YaaT (PSP1 superfamily)